MTAVEMSRMWLPRPTLHRALFYSLMLSQFTGIISETTTETSANPTTTESGNTTVTMVTTPMEPTTTPLECGVGEENVMDVCVCMSGYYNNNDTCLPCTNVTDHCLTCTSVTEGGGAMCTECNGTMYLHDSKGTCHEKCPRGSRAVEKSNGTINRCQTVSACTFRDGEWYEVCIAVPIAGAAVIVGIILLVLYLVKRRKPTDARNNPREMERRPSVLPNPFDSDHRADSPRIPQTIIEEPENVPVPEPTPKPKPQPAPKPQDDPQEYYGNASAFQPAPKPSRHLPDEDDEPQEDYVNVTKPMHLSRSVPNLQNTVPPPPGSGHTTKQPPGYVNIPSLPHSCSTPSDLKKHSYINVKNDKNVQSAAVIKHKSRHRKRETLDGPPDGYENQVFDPQDDRIYGNA